MANVAMYELHLKKKERLFRRMQATYDLLNKPNSDSLVVARFDDYKTDLEAYMTICEDIDGLYFTDKSISTNPPDTTISAYEDLYFTVKAKVMELKAATDRTKPNNKNGCEVPPHSEVREKLKLPKLAVPQFSGKVADFPAFISLYNSVVHEAKITPIEKFFYLKSYLTGEAHDVISSITVDSRNYSIAYDKLMNKYNDKRVLGAHYMYAISNMKPLTGESATGIQKFLNNFDCNIKALKELRLNDLSDFMILFMALRLLDAETRQKFESSHKKEIPTYSDLIEFLEGHYKVLLLASDGNKPQGKPSAHKSLISTQEETQQNSDSALPHAPENTNGDSKSPTSKPPKPKYNKYKQKLFYPCPSCASTDHPLYKCEDLLSLQPPQRESLVIKLGRCLACFGKHQLTKCQSNKCCLKCQSKAHNTLLHVETQVDVTSAVEAQPNQESNSSSQVLSCSLIGTNPSQTTVLLSTAQILMKDKHGEWHKVRAVLDNASQLSFITNSLSRKLGLTPSSTNINVSGVGDSGVSAASGVVSTSFRPHHTQDPIIELNAVLLPKIAGDLPSSPVCHSVRSRFTSLVLADPDYDCPAEIDVLLGASLIPDLYVPGTSMIKGDPSAFLTVLGWVLIGNAPTQQLNSSATSLLVCSSETDELIRRFWELENTIIPPAPIENPDDTFCESHFVAHHFRDLNGRYGIRFPFKKTPVLGGTRDIALRRVYNLEARLSKLNSLQRYYDGLKEYVELGHIRPATVKSEYIMTHHVVFKESSTTSLRVVFNASQKGPDGNSLNDFLHVGPKLQSNIEDIVLNFRRYAVTLTCDIKMCFRMISVHPDHRKYLHLMFRLSPSEPISEWELTVLPFGVNTSPFLSQRALRQLALDEGHRFPVAAQALLNTTYVDDIVCGADSEEKAIELYEQLVALLKMGGFELRKFSSNSPNVTSHIPDSKQEYPYMFDINKDKEDKPPKIKVLGLQYQPSRDVFCYHVPDCDVSDASKRTVLSDVSRIYDVNGYLCPVIVWVKIFLQKLWVQGLGWDERFDRELEEEWIGFTSQLSELRSIEIPRYVLAGAKGEPEIVGMCDASTRAYAAAIYLRVPISESEFSCRLLRAKSRVAPLKVVSTPRLELCAALMMSHLLKSLKGFISSLGITKIHLFTDSTVVLSWLRTPPYKLKTFVANRVVDILDLTSPEYWNHIPSEMNSADVASRSVLPSQLVDHALWWHGPTFLSLNEGWPKSFRDYIPEERLPETKPSSQTLLVTKEDFSDLYKTQARFSSFLRLQRVFAYVLRFVHNARNKQDRRKGPLFASEHQLAIRSCVRVVQQAHFAADILQLGKGCCVAKRMSSLSPFLENGVLRAGGRLRNAPIPRASKHPYILPKNCHLSRLICNYYHLLSLHGGILLTQSLIRRQFWIFSNRSLLTSQMGKCQDCYKENAPTLQPLMSDLPASRFSQVRAFINVGTDFCGPFLLKESKRRNARANKCYVCLFVCMSVKAVHIELVTELSTPAFLAAFDRFISRRGLPQNIYSDNGTNYVGAANELSRVYDFLQSSQNAIHDHLQSQLISWHFNPPNAPNFGGLWEAAVKSCKRHLKRLISSRPLTMEEFSTLLARVEAVLNSRPLFEPSNDPKDGFEYLTPGHFIIGAPLLARPEAELPSTEIRLLDRWTFISQALQAFWKCWSQEYLHSLMKRTKWTQDPKSLQVGDVVLVKGTTTISPQQWNLARVEDVSPGDDGRVRVVTIRTQQGSIMKRPVNKLLPIPSN